MVHVQVGAPGATRLAQIVNMTSDFAPFTEAHRHSTATSGDRPRAASAHGTVVRIDPLVDARWDSFVRSHPSATVYHLAAWARIFEKAYRYTPRYLALEDEAGQLVAAMPLMTRLGLRGRVLRSLPGYEIGGPIGLDREGQAKLMTAARSIAEAEGARAHVDSFTPGLEQEAPGWIAIERPPNWVLTLPSDEDGLERWTKVRSRVTLVQRIRQAARAGVRVREGDSAEDLRNFYHMLLANMRRKHSVTRTLRQLELTKQLLSPSGCFKLWIAEYRGRPIAGHVTLPFGDTVESLHIAHEEGGLPFHPHHALNRQAMSWAMEHGFSKYSLGHAWPESSLGFFKARWGAEPQLLYGYAWRPGGIPESERTHTHGVVAGGHSRILSWVWERTPLPLLGIATAFARRALL